MKSLFVSSKVESRIAALEKTGKSGKNLAQKATGIIARLASGDFRNHMDPVATYTKYGEKRTKNCRKYDLGCGYRLITMKRGETVCIPFLGSHDECQRWLENNSRFKAFRAGKGSTVHIEGRNSSPANLGDVENMDVGADVDRLLENLTDKDLRTLFNGLVKGAGNGPR